MKLKITYLFLCAIVVSACSHDRPVYVESVGQNKSISLAKKDIPVSFFPDPIRIVSIGDSLTQGVGDSTEAGGYLPYLRNRLEKEPQITTANFINHGIRGNRTDQLLKRLDSEKLRQDIIRADCVIITIGGNDIMKVVRENFSNLTMGQFEQAKTGYEERLEKIMSRVRSYNSSTQIYLVGLYNPFSKWLTAFKELDLIMDEWNESSREIVSRYGDAYFIEIGDIFKQSKEDLLFTEDYFHPNDRGYELIAARIYKNMEENKFTEDTLEASAKGDEE
ncbi:GDSL family lipase [Peribacillus cavernae]|uniref:GDSL family lipase n=1 Tax=Peribacillus cavernae TaxID=1674310 RepID=A0A433HW81_9BACI|nr:SGNH/GDSL hydrolase family protein [Peribacillus cavernae]MDQ0217965.1 lysophospholipase L1-like esterase [Peribacillus cavernae]RUQ32610.1 GDSL family lipase [Peribacillus cavernae]